MRVQVAIDLALDRLFTYEVPRELEKKLAVGQLLSVPFGHREARGFAMAVSPAEAGGGLTEQPPAKLKLKPVTAIVDETPFFSPALLTLVKKVAAYTAAPLETVLRTALPAAVLKKNAKAKEHLFVEPVSIQSGSGVSPLQQKNFSPPLTKRQSWLIENIVRLGGGWLTQLCTELKTTSASLKQLAALGLVTIAPRAKRRSPLGNRKILPSKPLPLNEEQRKALEKIYEGESASRLSRPSRPPSRLDDIRLEIR